MDSIDDKDNAGEAEFEILRDAVSSGDGRPPAGRASSGAALAVDVAKPQAEGQAVPYGAS